MGLRRGEEDAVTSLDRQSAPDWGNPNNFEPRTHKERAEAKGETPDDIAAAVYEALGPHRGKAAFLDDAVSLVVAERDRAVAFADWICSLDGLEGADERRTITLTRIIERAREALGDA